MVSGGSSKLKSQNSPFSEDDLDGESEGVGLKVDRKNCNVDFMSISSQFQDVKQILPTCIILLITLAITVTVIPYAFSSVIKYLIMFNMILEFDIFG